jgi:hypothetical protein
VLQAAADVLLTVETATALPSTAKASAHATKNLFMTILPELIPRLAVPGT